MNLSKSPHEYQDAVLKLLKDHENLIGDLYDLYATKGIGGVEFWKNLAEEERNHAYWIETLTNSIGGGKIYFNEERFNAAPLEHVIAYIKENIANAEKNPIGNRVALSVANDIETGMIEKSFFEVFESDSVEIKNTFKMLREATAKHRSMVREMLEKERNMKDNSETGIFQRIKKFFGI